MVETTTIAIEVPVTKECTRCHRTFGYMEFAPGKSGLTAACRVCRSAASQASKVRKRTGEVLPWRQCADCGEDLVDRGPSAVRCRPCQAVHTRELALIRDQKRKASGRKQSSSKARYEAQTADERELEYRSGMLHKYNLTVEQYDSMLNAQGGGCAICGEPETVRTRGTHDPYLAVDHDRSCCNGPFSCGECVRGLLCMNHNTGIGLFCDDIELLESAIAYIQKWRIRKSEMVA